jgi:predicted phage tail protein
VRLSNYVLGVPAAVAAVVVAVANRQSVIFSLDPFSQASPALALRLPLFVLLFVTLGLGVLLGGLASLLSRKPPSPEDGASNQKSKFNLLPGRSSGSKTPSR